MSNEDVVEYLTALHAERDWPTTRALAGRTGISHTHVADLLTGKQRGRWQTVKKLVEALGGDVDEARELYEPHVGPSVRKVPVHVLDDMIARLDRIEALLNRLLGDETVTTEVTGET